MRTELVSKEKEPWSGGYTIDLREKLFCPGVKENCYRPFQIQSVKPDEIVFSDERTADLWGRSRVDRITGNLSISMMWFAPKIARGSYEVNAACTRGPFTGFPQTKF
jgi:hypothetical protein